MERFENLSKEEQGKVIEEVSRNAEAREKRISQYQKEIVQENCSIEKFKNSEAFL